MGVNKHIGPDGFQCASDKLTDLSVRHQFDVFAFQEAQGVEIETSKIDVHAALPTDQLPCPRRIAAKSVDDKNGLTWGES